MRNGELEWAVRTEKNFWTILMIHTSLFLHTKPRPYLGVAFPLPKFWWVKKLEPQCQSKQRFLLRNGQIYKKKFPKDDSQYEKKQKRHYDKRHRAHDLPEFSDDTPVFICIGGSSSTVPGRIVISAGLRSYNVGTATGHSWCNRSQLHYRSADETCQSSVCRSPITTRIKTGTVLRPPNKLRLWLWEGEM